MLRSPVLPGQDARDHRAAFLGACAAIALTLTLSRGVLQTATLLLAGIVVAFLLGAVTSLLLLRSRTPGVRCILPCSGATGFLSWRSTGLLVCGLAICAVPTVLLSRGLDALSLGRGDSAVARNILAGDAARLF